MYALTLFGGLSLASDSGPVAPAALQRRRVALLALLALRGVRGVARERIQAQLWPDSSPDRARHALDQLLYASRRDLGRDVIVSGGGGELRLNGALVRADLWAFDAAIATGRWAHAAALYAGPLLDGLHLVDEVEFERTLDAERARRASEYGRALDALAAEAAAAHDHTGAARWRRQRAAADPLDASVAIDLMHALAAAGDHVGAVQHARVYQRLVRDGLGIEPDRGVEALATALAAGPGGAPSPTPAAGHALASGDGDGPATTAGPAAGDAPPAALAPPAARRPRSAARLAAVGALVAAVSALAALRLVPTPPAAGEPTATGPAVPARGVGATAAASRTGDPAARAIYLRARAAWERRTRPGLEEAVVLYRRATERDPGYAAAYAGLAQSYAMLGYFGFAPGDAMFPKARAAASRAIDLDPDAGEAYAALGQALAWQHDWAGAERAYQRALALTPGDATVHQWYALLLAYEGRPHEAAHHTGLASGLDPLSVQINNMHGMMLYYAGDLGGALGQYERTVDAEPDSAWVRQNPWVLSNFGHVAAAAGQHARAVGLIGQALTVVPTHPRPRLDLAYAYTKAGEPHRARAAFAAADSAHPHYAMYRALLHATLDERDEAFAWLARVGEWPLPALVGLANDPRYTALRGDPRYRAVRERLRLSAR